MKPLPEKPSLVQYTVDALRDAICHREWEEYLPGERQLGQRLHAVIVNQLQYRAPNKGPPRIMPDLIAGETRGPAPDDAGPAPGSH